METTWTEWTITHILTEDGVHITECDEDFTEDESDDEGGEING